MMDWKIVRIQECVGVCVYVTILAILQYLENMS